MSGKGSRLWAELASNCKETVASLPTEEPAPSAAPTALASLVATATLVPMATALPTAVPPTQIPDVTIPDLHDLSEKEVQDRLKKPGLQARNVDTCTSSESGR